jgi:hypothetical protein
MTGGRGFVADLVILDEAFDYRPGIDEAIDYSPGIVTYIDPGLVFTKPFDLFDLVLLYAYVAGIADPYAHATSAVTRATGQVPCAGDHSNLDVYPHGSTRLPACPGCGAAI